MSDLTFGIKLTADGKQLVGEVRASREEFDKLGTSVQRAAGKMASDYSGLNKTVKEHAAAVSDTDGKVTKLLDRYDPLGAKLRQLQADFKALDAAAGSGKIAGRDDARVDAVYAKMRQEMEGAGQASVNLGLNTQYARREMMMLGKEALTGDFSRMPQTFASLATHSELLPALISPIGLAVAGVTAALAAGAYAWSHWETVAVESAEKTMGAIRLTLGETKRIASMSNEARDAEIADVEQLIKTHEAYASHVTATTTRFNWRDSAAQLALYNAEIEKNRARLGELRATSDAAPAAQSIIDKTLKFDRIRAKQDEITKLDAANKKELVDAKQYLDARKVLEKELADLQKPEKAKRTEADQIRQQEQQVLQSLQKQADGYQQLSKVEQARWEIENGNYRKFSEQAKQRILLEAQLADAKDAETKSVKASKDAWEESAKAIDKANTTSKEYVNQLQFENSLLGKNALDVQVLTEKRRIDLVLEKELLALRNSDKFKARDSNPEVDAAYQAAVKGAADAADAARKGADIELVARDQVTRSWEFGSSEAIRKYNDQVRNSAAQAEALYTKAFKGAEDAVTKFAMTGKLNIRDFAQTVIEEFVRINVSRPMVSAGSGMLSDLLGVVMGSMAGTPAAGGGGGENAAPGSANDVLAMMGAGRASGGEVYPNTLHPVNERGPELLNYGGSDYLMMGGRGGYVKPLTSAGGGAPSSSGTVIHLTNSPVINIDSRTDQAEVYKLVDNAVQHGNAQLVDKLQRQGVL